MLNWIWAVHNCPNCHHQAYFIFVWDTTSAFVFNWKMGSCIYYLPCCKKARLNPQKSTNNSFAKDWGQVNWVHDWDIPVPSWHMLIWIDETGSERRNSIQKYGYSLSGMRAQVFQLRVGGEHISAITTCDIEDVCASKETINGERFDCVNVCCPSSCPMMVWIHTQLWWCQHSPFSCCDRHHYWCRGQTCISTTVHSWSYAAGGSVCRSKSVATSKWQYLSCINNARTNGQISVYHNNTRKLHSLHRACWLHIDCTLCSFFIQNLLDWPCSFKLSIDSI